MPRRFTSTGPVIAGIGFGVAAGVFLGSYGIGPVVEGSGAASASGDEGVRGEYRKILQQSQIDSAQLNSGESILADLGPRTVDGSLAQRSILVITTAEADKSDVAAIESLLKSAGSESAGTISLSEDFFSPSSADTLESLLTNTLPAGANLSMTDRSLGMHAGEALGAAVFVDPLSGQSLAEPDERDALLHTLRDKGFINYDEGSINPAQAVVVIDGHVDGRDDLKFRADNTAAFMNGLSQVGRNVVLSARIEEAADTGPIGLLRAQEQSNVTTVDSSNRWWARIATVLAVREQLDGGHGAYGSAASADAASPALAPANEE